MRAGGSRTEAEPSTVPHRSMERCRSGVPRLRATPSTKTPPNDAASIKQVTPIVAPMAVPVLQPIDNHLQRTMPDTDIVERAFQLARGCSCRSLDDIRRQLKREGFEAVDSHLDGGTIKRQLTDAMKMLG